jgi:hypothetical protein
MRHRLGILGRAHICQRDCSNSSHSRKQLPLWRSLDEFHRDKPGASHHFSPRLEKVEGLTNLSAQIERFLICAKWSEMGALFTSGAFAAIGIQALAKNECVRSHSGASSASTG